MTPADAAVRMEQALGLQERGEYRQALEVYAGIFRYYPDHPDVLHNAGLANLFLQRYGTAEELLLRVVQLRPGSDRARSTLVKLWARMDRSQTLAEISTDGAWINVLDFDASMALADHLLRRREFSGACGVLSRAVALNASDARASHLLGMVLSRLNAAEEGEAQLRQALRLDPGNTHVMFDLARCQFAMHLRSKQQQHWEEGCALIGAALRLAPADARLHHEMGLIHEHRGEFDAAKAAYRQALSCKAGHLPALSGLVALSRADASQALLDELEGAAERVDGSSSEQRSRAWQSLGKCYDSRGEYGRAFPFFEKAKGLQAGDRRYDRSGRERYVDNLIETYSRGALEQLAMEPAGVERPVFIVGMPRSGTTLLEHMLAGHPEIAGAGEVPFFTALECTGRALHDASGARSVHWDERVRPEYRRRLRAEFDGILDEAGQGARFVTDKMPFNFAQLGIIASVYPGAKIIHCRRDALDVGLSCFIETFGESHDWCLRLSDIGHYYRQYERLMTHWTGLFAGCIHELHYQNLVEAPEAALSGVLDHLGLGLHTGWSAYLDNERAIRTPSHWQVRQPVYTSSLGRSRHYRERLGPLIDALGASG